MEKMSCYFFDNNEVSEEKEVINLYLIKLLKNNNNMMCKNYGF
jgi:hypothetical protein